jgi:N-acetylmuramate 1-kinase
LGVPASDSFFQLISVDVEGVLGAGPFELLPLMGDASTRRYYRAVHGTRSLIVMRLPEDAFKSDEGGAAVAVTELPFVNVQRFLAANAVPVPAILIDQTAKGYLLLEDLGEPRLEDALIAARKSTPGDEAAFIAVYMDAIDLLAKFKATFAALQASDCVAKAKRFDTALLRWELDHFTEWGVEAGTGTTYSPEDKAVVDAGFNRLVASLEALPAVLTHRDFQSRNIMAMPQPRGLVLIDFQDALLGPAIYDVVALFRDSYVSIEPATLDRLLAGAFTRLVGLPGIPATEAEFRRQFHMQTLQRKLKDAGRFVFIDRVRKNPNFLPYIPQSLAYVRHAFASLSGEYDDLWHTLAKYRPELA